MRSLHTLGAATLIALLASATRSQDQQGSRPLQASLQSTLLARPYLIRAVAELPPGPIHSFRYEPSALSGAVPSQARSDSESRDHSREYERDRRARRLDLRARLFPEMASATALRQQLERLGAQHTRVLLGGAVISAWLTPTSKRELETKIDPHRIIPDRLFDAQLDVSTTAIHAPTFWGNLIRGSNRTSFEAGILDSGIDVRHPGLRPAAFLFSVVHAQASGDPSYNDSLSPDDFAGHGTPIAGIIMGRGSATWQNHRGVAWGLARGINLKSAFRRSNGNAGLYLSDAIANIDIGVFGLSDDIDSLNFSFGIPTNSDDSSLARFMDALVADLGIPTIVSAGNGGPSARSLVNPATAYNVITTGSMYDFGTNTRRDDLASISSARGPTIGGRKKPDLLAPGGFITSPTARWETQLDYQSNSGTSFAAPHVTGAVHLIMDALGPPIDPRVVKALLINNADDWGVRGWDATNGWGYINLQKTWTNLRNYFRRAVSPRGTSGDFDLFRGPVNAGDKASLVWHRHVDYRGAGLYPNTWYRLNNLDIFLYDEANGALEDSSTSRIDNVEQVTATRPYDAVIKVRSQDRSFAAVTAESYALATPKGFAFPPRLPRPTATLFAATPIAVDESATVLVRVTNQGDFRCFSPTVSLSATGFATGQGTSLLHQLANPLQRDGKDAQLTAWKLRAKPTPAQSSLSASVNASGYGESWQGTASPILSRSVTGKLQRVAIVGVTLQALGNQRYLVRAAVLNESIVASTSSFVQLLTGGGTSLVTGTAVNLLPTIPSGQASQTLSWTLRADSTPRFALAAQGKLSNTQSRAVYTSFGPSLPSGTIAYGASTPGCSGPLTIGADSSPSLGNQDFALTCRAAPPSSTGALIVGNLPLVTAQVFLGVSLWVDPQGGIFVPLSAKSDAQGLCTTAIPIPATPSLVGTRLHAQYLWADACAQSGLSASGALAVTVQL